MLIVRPRLVAIDSIEAIVNIRKVLLRLFKLSAFLDPHLHLARRGSTAPLPSSHPIQSPNLRDVTLAERGKDSGTARFGIGFGWVLGLYLPSCRYVGLAILRHLSFYSERDTGDEQEKKKVGWGTDDNDLTQFTAS
jgi:hypothetical protein